MCCLLTFGLGLWTTAQKKVGSNVIPGIGELLDWGKRREVVYQVVSPWPFGVSQARAVSRVLVRPGESGRSLVVFCVGKPSLIVIMDRAGLGFTMAMACFEQWFWSSFGLLENNVELLLDVISISFYTYN